MKANPTKPVRGLKPHPKKPYSVQGKNGTHAGWGHFKFYSDYETAEQAAIHLMHKRRGKPGTEWFKTRVAVFKDGEWRKSEK